MEPDLMPEVIRYLAVLSIKCIGNLSQTFATSAANASFFLELATSLIRKTIVFAILAVNR